MTPSIPKFDKRRPVKAVKRGLMSKASSRSKAHVRLKDDAYFSPRPLAKAIVDRLVPLMHTRTIESEPVRHILEPSAGDGAFVEAAKAAWPHARITALEPNRISSSSFHLTQHRTTFEAWCAAREKSKAAKLAMPRDIDLVIGNPPYSLAEAHVTLARQTSPVVAFLLRLSFLGSQERERTLWSAPGLRYLIPIARRPSFTGGGSDACEYAVFIWERGFAGNAELLPHLKWQP